MDHLGILYKQSLAPFFL